MILRNGRRPNLVRRSFCRGLHGFRQPTENTDIHKSSNIVWLAPIVTRLGEFSTIGRIFDYWAIVFCWQFLKITEGAQIFGLLFDGIWDTCDVIGSKPVHYYVPVNLVCCDLLPFPQFPIKLWTNRMCPFLIWRGLWETSLRCYESSQDIDNNKEEDSSNMWADGRQFFVQIGTQKVVTSRRMSGDTTRGRCRETRRGVSRQRRGHKRQPRRRGHEGHGRHNKATEVKNWLPNNFLILPLLSFVFIIG
jgi:hypothetical protein